MQQQTTRNRSKGGLLVALVAGVSPARFDLSPDGAFTILSFFLAAVAGPGLAWSRPVASSRSTETMT